MNKDNAITRFREKFESKLMNRKNNPLKYRSVIKAQLEDFLEEELKRAREARDKEIIEMVSKYREEEPEHAGHTRVEASQYSFIRGRNQLCDDIITAIKGESE